MVFFKSTRVSCGAQASKKVQVSQRGQAPNRAQGTVEYLVIIAIVVVISLVVVGLVMTQMGSAENVSQTSSEIKNKVGINGVSIVDSIAGEDGNGAFVLKNMGSETLIVTSINVDGVDHNYSESIVMGAQQGFRLSDIAVCDGTKKVYAVTVYYTTSYNLEKSSAFETITIDCIAVVNPSSNFVEEDTSGGGEGDEEPVVHLCGELATPVGYSVISDCTTISSNGNYILDDNLSCPSGLTIADDDVNINGNYCTFTGDISASGVGANAFTDLNLSNITVVGNVLAVGADKLEGIAYLGGVVTVVDSNITSVMVTGGSGGTGEGSAGAGGEGGTVIVTNSTVPTINAAGGAGGSGSSTNGGNGGTITSTNSTVGAINAAGGMSTANLGGSGGVVTVADSNITTITVAGAEDSGGSGGNSGTVNLNNCIVSGAITATGGGGISASGAGGVVTVINNSILFSINTAGGAGMWGGEASVGGAVNVTDSTVTTISTLGGNSGGVPDGKAGGAVTISNSDVSSITTTGGSTEGTGGNGGAVTATNNSTIGTINATGGGGEGAMFGGTGGTISLTNSTATTITSSGGASSTEYGLGGNGATMTLTSSEVSTIIAVGGVGGPGGMMYDKGGDGGNITFSPCQDPPIQAPSVTVTGGVPNGIDGTITPETCHDP